MPDLSFEEFERHLQERAAIVRAEVAEEIAQAIEATIGGYPHNDAARPKLDVAEFANDAAWAAQIARQHATT